MFTLVTWISPTLPAKHSLRVQTFRLTKYLLANLLLPLARSLAVQTRLRSHHDAT